MLKRIIIHIDRTGVVEREHAIGMRVIEQLAYGFEGGTPVGYPVRQTFLERQSRVTERLTVPFEPSDLGDGRLIAADVCNAMAPGVNEAHGGVIPDGEFVRLNPRVDEGAFLGVDYDNLLAVECPRHVDVLVGEFGIHVTVHAPAEHTGDVVADIAFVVGIDNEHHVPKLACGIFHAMDDFAGVRGGGDLVTDTSDGVRPAAAQRTRHGVGMISEFVGDFPDARRNFGVDAAFVSVVDDQRDCGS